MSKQFLPKEKTAGGAAEGYQKIETGVVEGFTGMTDKLPVPF